MKQRNIYRTSFILFAVVTFAWMFFGTFSMQAQQAGDIVEVTWAGENTKGRVDTCSNNACYLYLYDTSSGKWSEGTAFFRNDQIRGLKKSEPEANRQEDTNKSRQKGVSITATPAPKLPECSLDAPAAKISRTTPASEQAFKRVIYDWFALDVKEGGTTNPLKVGVTFLEFQMGKSFVNRIYNDPGTGAHRMHDGAPTDATIYPVKTKYIHCSAYRDSIQRQVVQENFACFKDKFGDWTCPTDSVRKILETTSIPTQK
jgi:hypothetical protein